MVRSDKQKLHVFLSHASEDKKQVRNLSKRLRSDGFDPWLDEERLLPGQDWNLEIEKALRASDAILLCFSTLSVNKEGYIQREYKRAMTYLEEKPEGTIYVIPVRLDDGELPYFIRQIQCVDYPADYNRLVRSLQSRAGDSVKNIISLEPAKGEFGHNAMIDSMEDIIGGTQSNSLLQREQTEILSTPFQYIEKLERLKNEIEQMRSQFEKDPAAIQDIDLIKVDLQHALDEAHKEVPIAKYIHSALRSAKNKLQKLNSSSSATASIVVSLANMELMALTIYGSSK